ncbi:VOC family protein [Caldifermentibacillus hisashii]
MGEVTIKVENLQRSIEFYTTIIGLKVLTQTGEQAILTTDGKIYTYQKVL